jgi:hypothetical protein
MMNNKHKSAKRQASHGYPVCASAKNNQQEDTMTRPEAIKAFFNTPGYPPVENAELLKLGKNHKEDFRELGDMCLAALGETLTERV